jgi:hypothetical protein
LVSIFGAGDESIIEAGKLVREMDIYDNSIDSSDGSKGRFAWHLEIKDKKKLFKDICLSESMDLDRECQKKFQRSISLQLHFWYSQFPKSLE